MILGMYISKLKGQRTALLNSYAYLVIAVKEFPSDNDKAIARFLDILDHLHPREYKSIIKLLCRLTRTAYHKDEYGYIVPNSYEAIIKRVKIDIDHCHNQINKTD